MKLIYSTWIFVYGKYVSVCEIYRGIRFLFRVFIIPSIIATHLMFTNDGEVGVVRRVSRRPPREHHHPLGVQVRLVVLPQDGARQVVHAEYLMINKSNLCHMCRLKFLYIFNTRNVEYTFTFLKVSVCSNIINFCDCLNLHDMKMIRDTSI